MRPQLRLFGDSLHGVESCREGPRKRGHPEGCRSGSVRAPVPIARGDDARSPGKQGARPSAAARGVARGSLGGRGGRLGTTWAIAASSRRRRASPVAKERSSWERPGAVVWGGSPRGPLRVRVVRWPVGRRRSPVRLPGSSPGPHPEGCGRPCGPGARRRCEHQRRPIVQVLASLVDPWRPRAVGQTLVGSVLVGARRACGPWSAGRTTAVPCPEGLGSRRPMSPSGRRRGPVSGSAALVTVPACAGNHDDTRGGYRVFLETWRPLRPLLHASRASRGPASPDGHRKRGATAPGAESPTSPGRGRMGRRARPRRVALFPPVGGLRGATRDG